MTEYEKLLNVIKILRAPNGCPWDREQTPQSLRASLLEEVYETIEAINENDNEHIKEEIGDIFINIFMIAIIFEETQTFTLEDIYKVTTEKLTRRHPHVFPPNETNSLQKEYTTKVKNATDVLEQWDTIKRTIEGRKTKSIIDEVSAGLPPLLRAYKIQKKAAKQGFDWESITGAEEKLHEEITEFKEACLKQDTAAIEDEAGDILFAAVNVIRHAGANPALALNRAITKFSKRFKSVELLCEQQNISLKKASAQKKDELWDLVKKEEK